MVKQVDVCIVGGGFCGLILAHALHQLGIKCLLLEQRDRLSRGQDARALVLSYGSGLILKQLGLLPQGLSRHSITQLNYSMRGVFGGVDIHAHDYQVPWLGQVVRADHWLNQCLETVVLPEIWCGVTLTALREQAAMTEITCQWQGKRQTIHAGLVIGADGTHSWVAQQMGWQPRIELSDYRALVVPVSGVGEQGAWLRASQVGTLAFVPHAATHGVLIWTGPKATITRMENHAVLRQLSQRMGGARLKGMVMDQARVTVFPVMAQQLENMAAAGVVCVGNALHTLPPVSAQGFNLGIRDCAVLVEQIALLKGQRRAWRDTDALAQFMQQRQPDIQKTMQLSLMATHAYAWAKPWGPLASLGLLTLEADWASKRDHVFHALGLAKPYGALMRGVNLETLPAAVMELL